MAFKQFTVQRQLRYSLFPETHGNGKHLLVALHGYGQLIEFFSKKFQNLGDDYVVVCPEGMHRFYLEGTSGRVGASWMTREWREQDILDNTIALNQLVGSIVEELKPDTITVLGFSQGVATAARWINNTELNIDRFIAWAGVFPPDLPMDSNIHFPEQKKVVVGNNDPYFQGDDLEKMLDIYRDLRFDIFTFEGKHEMNEDLLKVVLT